MSDGSTTLSTELQAPQSLPTCFTSKRSRAGQRPLNSSPYLLGPENVWVCRGLGLTAVDADHWRLDPSIVPLVLYADSGSGKTQLLQALAAIGARQDSPEAVLLTTAADFARACTSAANLDELPRLQQRYQRCGLLLLDDLHQLAPKANAQRQLEIMIEHRQRHQRPTVLVAQRPLHELGLSARLTSRLASGLVLRLEPPGAATRRAILRHEAQQRRLSLSSDAERRLCDCDTLSVPEMIGLLNRLVATIQPPTGPTGRFRPNATVRMSRPNETTDDATREKLTRIDASQIETLLQSPTPSPALDPRRVIRATARYFGLQPRNLTGTSRRKLEVLARSIAMFLIREMTATSFQQIGRYFGGRDHTTVIHAHRKVVANQERDTTTRHAVQEIRRQLMEGVR